MGEFTTIALTEDDKSRLDNIAEQHLNDGNTSYRKTINYLIDEIEERHDDYEYVLAKAIAGASEEDVSRIISRVESDKNFVEDLNNE